MRFSVADWLKPGHHERAPNSRQAGTGLGPAPELVKALGASYHTSSVDQIGFEPDVIIECTGVGQVIADSIKGVASGGIICLTGVGSGDAARKGATAEVAAAVVLKNNVIVGSVNANRRHWFKGAEALARADREWLSKLLTRRVKPEDFQSALARQSEDIKCVIQFSEA